MEKERFDEMKDNLSRLYESGELTSKKIFLFAHCKATMELADELFLMGLTPVAILDNNPDKHGLSYKGIPVRMPMEAVETDGAGDAIILIASRFYAQMASQMRKLGFKGRIEKMTDYNSYAEYSVSPDVLIQKSERLKRGIERLAGIKAEYRDFFVVFCPFPALGDVYFCLSYLKPYLIMNGYDKKYDGCLVCVVGNAQKQVVELFDYTAALRLDQIKMDEVIQAVIYSGDPDCYIAHQDRPYVVDLHRALYEKCIPLEMVYKCGVFGLPQDTAPIEPVNWRKFEFCSNSESVPAEDKDKRKTAIISPYAKSVAALPEELWTDMIKDLMKKGYEIYTNVAEGEKPLSGTKPISPKIAETRSAVEQAGLFIGIRSGICDVIKTAHCRKIALYPDYYYCDTKWKSIDMYEIDGFENVVVRDGDTWENVKKQLYIQ